MQDRIQGLLNQVKEWWDKFTTRQKTLIISVVAGVVVALAVLGTVLTRPHYTTLITCESTKDSSNIIDLLKENAIEYQVTTDGKVISVKDEDLSTATLLLGANDYPADGYSLSEALSGGFSTTEADKKKTYKLYMEKKLEDVMKAQNAVNAAYVTLNIPDDDGTLLSEKEEAYASVMLELNEELGTGVAENFAKNIATALGSKTPKNVTIIDSNGNLLYSGADTDVSNSNIVNTSNQLALKAEAERLVKQEVTSVLLGSNLYEDVKVAPNLSLDFSLVEQTEHTYTQADENGTNVLSHEDTYESTGLGAVEGVPGTDSNGEENTYVIQDDDRSSYSVTEESRDYLPGEKIVTTTIPSGAIKYDKSSIAITASHYVIYKEADVREQGLLDGISFEEFQLANSDMVKKTVDEEMITLVSNATGIPTANISIIAYDVPIFQADEGNGIQASDIAQIILIVLILALLGFVVFSTLRREKEPEPQEEELSVENLLQSTEEVLSSVEDIDVENKSEVWLMVEKFVDDNPDSAAALLRNWLNEGWG